MVKFVKINQLSLVVLFLMFAYHYGITLFTWYNTLNNPRSDALRYFVDAQKASSWFSLFGLSTTFVRFLNYPFIKWLGFNYLSLALLYSSLSFFSYFKLWAIARKLNPNKLKFSLQEAMLLFFLFLPSFHMWTSAVGKDTLVFFLTTSVLGLVIDKKSKIVSYVPYLCLALFIRPYLPIFLFAAFGIIYLMKYFNNARKVFISLFILVFGSISVIIVLNKLDIDPLTYFETQLNFVSRYSNYKKEIVGGSYIDPNTLSITERIFAFLYRPIFYDAQNISQIYISVENLCFIFATTWLLARCCLKSIKSSFAVKLMSLYVIIFVLVKSYSIYNLGLANRQKFQIYPILIFLIYYYLGYKKRNEAMF